MNSISQLLTVLLRKWPLAGLAKYLLNKDVTFRGVLAALSMRKVLQYIPCYIILFAEQWVIWKRKIQWRPIQNLFHQMLQVHNHHLLYFRCRGTKGFSPQRKWQFPYQLVSMSHLKKYEWDMLTLQRSHIRCIDCYIN